MIFNSHKHILFFSILFFLLSCGGEPEDCLGNPGGEAQLDDCGVCDNNEENDCILAELEGVWVGNESISPLNTNISFQFIFSENLVDVLGENDPNMSGGFSQSLSYNGTFLINETISNYNEIDISVIESNANLLGIQYLGIYNINDNILTLLKSHISRPIQSQLEGTNLSSYVCEADNSISCNSLGDTTSCNDLGNDECVISDLRLFTLTKQ